MTLFQSGSCFERRWVFRVSLFVWMALILTWEPNSLTIFRVMVGLQCLLICCYDFSISESREAIFSRLKAFFFEWIKIYNFIVFRGFVQKLKYQSVWLSESKWQIVYDEDQFAIMSPFCSQCDSLNQLQKKVYFINLLMISSVPSFEYFL